MQKNFRTNKASVVASYKKKDETKCHIDSHAAKEAKSEEPMIKEIFHDEN